ncbi:copper homeostasis protein CutC [Salinivirga cyanobacteriivorans]
MINRKLEICCYTAESAILAEAAGAHRIELCDNYAEGGTTPSFATIQKVVDNLDIPVNVIVRPRGGDFVYSEMEYAIIKEDVRQIKALGANGVVLGFLKSDGEIDIKRTKEIVSFAGNMEVTFHRAFDMCSDPFKALEQFIDIGVTRILTSGLKKRAMEGVELIAKFIEKAEDRIIIMPGSGVNDKNLAELIQQTNATEFHSSAKTFIQGKMQFQNESVSMSGRSNPEEFKHISVDQEQVNAMLKILNN